MSPYAFGGLLLAFVAWSGGMYYMGHSNEAVQCKATDEQVSIDAYKHKDEVTTKDATITQSEVTGYEKNFNAIGTLYSNGLPTASRTNMPVIPTTPVRICPVSSKQYKLSFRQCDVEEAKLKGLFDRDQKLSVVK